MKITIKTLVFFVFLVSFFLYIYIYIKPISPNNPIHSDGEGYYAYLPSIFIKKQIAIKDPSLYESTREVLQFPAFNLWKETGKYLNKYPMGEAILLLPSFVLASIFSYATNVPLDGYNSYYQHLVGLSASVYLSLAILFLNQVYSKLFSKNLSLLTIFTLLFATNLLHYSTYDSTFSHVFAFFVISVFLYLTQQWYKKRNSVNSIILGLFLGLAFLIRNTHIFLLTIFIFYGIYSKESMSQRFSLFLNSKRYLFLLFFSFLLIIFPQFLYHYLVTDHFFVFSYINEGFNLLNPAWYGVIISPRKGLLFWSPLFFISCFSIFKLKKIRSWVFASSVVVLIETYLIATWHQWWFGDSFGHRGFIDIYPIFGLFLASGLNFLLNKRVIKYFTLVFLIFLIFLNLLLMSKYWKGVLPRDHVTLNSYLKSLSLSL